MLRLEFFIEMEIVEINAIRIRSVHEFHEWTRIFLIL